MSPWDRTLYPESWPEIRAAILKRAGNRCERCGVANGSIGARDRQGAWHDQREIDCMKSDVGEAMFGDYPRIIRIVLTVAHLDHDVANNDPSNLAARCQRCHLTHDARRHAAHARVTRARKRGQMFLFPEVFQR